MNMPIMGHRPRVVRIQEARTETPTMTSLLFEDERCAQAKPGQFAMIWIPGVDEIPMCISHLDDKRTCGVTVRSIGYATEALRTASRGQQIGVRGPYGNGFQPGTEKKVLIVAGGTGIACVAPLIEKMSLEKRTLSIVVGARSGPELVFFDRISRAVANTDSRLLAVTDDGSVGSKGLALEHALKLLDKERFDEAYTCGPELMMDPLVSACIKRGIQVQASLERYVKCGMGLCGSCAIGPYLVCKDGPVFKGSDLASLPEFGKTKRDASGALQAIQS